MPVHSVHPIVPGGGTGSLFVGGPITKGEPDVPCIADGRLALRVPPTTPLAWIIQADGNPVNICAPHRPVVLTELAHLVALAGYASIQHHHQILAATSGE